MHHYIRGVLRDGRSFFGQRMEVSVFESFKGVALRGCRHQTLILDTIVYKREGHSEVHMVKKRDQGRHNQTRDRPQTKALFFAKRRTHSHKEVKKGEGEGG